ncbi:ankyrin repeat-containing protein [Hibiscus syriacus]|uniref:Ankyrin repeat-containing protein n=1 Tax=Hibiscus syriacus TaxID=106335 RepID=A0A6A3BDK4_HIBSY|nr:probable membrane-associated kinase regulator 4 [Hibiscus syriacus]KAE8713915.1 ankyrin repeat-containing protein [Hibiscus syriacus]
MAVNRVLPNELQVEDDEYIEMEVSSYSNFFCNSSISSQPPHFPIEFEFQMSWSSMETEPTTSPADELFYKGKLLPLHLPPRLHMVEKLLQNSTSSVYEDFYTTPLTTTATTTPYESCNVSPSESCRISRELNPEECSFEYSTEALSGRCNGENHRKKSSSIGSKLKSYRAYLNSLFSISGCSSESCSAAKVADEGSILRLRAKERLDRSMMMKATKKAPFGQIHHRRSFSLAVKRQHYTDKSSSSNSTSSSGSSSCPSSNGTQNLRFLKRSISVNVEVESPIQGAIAHCKQSQLIRSEPVGPDAPTLSNRTLLPAPMISDTDDMQSTLKV